MRTTEPRRTGDDIAALSLFPKRLLRMFLRAMCWPVPVGPDNILTTIRRFWQQLELKLSWEPNAPWAADWARESVSPPGRGRNRAAGLFPRHQFPEPSGCRPRNGSLPIPRAPRKTVRDRRPGTQARARGFEIFRNCALR